MSLIMIGTLFVSFSFFFPPDGGRDGFGHEFFLELLSKFSHPFFFQWGSFSHNLCSSFVFRGQVGAPWCL